MYFQKSLDYWGEKDPTEIAMLDGNIELSEIDLNQSEAFLVSQNLLNFRRVLDCGSGVGRVSKQLLSKYFFKIDLIEPIKKFCVEAKKQIDPKILGKIYPVPLQTFKFELNYDCIWFQWSSLYLSDNDFLYFLYECRRHLNENGIVIIKENITFDNVDRYIDDEDNSVTRSHGKILEIIKQSRLKLKTFQEQLGFPEDFYPVMMYSLY